MQVGGKERQIIGKRWKIREGEIGEYMKEKDVEKKKPFPYKSEIVKVKQVNRR